MSNLPRSLYASLSKDEAMHATPEQFHLIEAENALSQALELLEDARGHSPGVLDLSTATEQIHNAIGQLHEAWQEMSDDTE